MRPIQRTLQTMIKSVTVKIGPAEFAEARDSLRALITRSPESRILADSYYLGIVSWKLPGDTPECPKSATNIVIASLTPETGLAPPGEGFRLTPEWLRSYRPLPIETWSQQREQLRDGMTGALVA